MENKNWKSVYEGVQEVLLADTEVRNGIVHPRWISNSRFWYQRKGDSGVEYRVVEATSGASVLTVSQKAISAALSAALGAQIDPNALLLTSLQVDPSLKALTFSAFGDFWQFEVGTSGVHQPLKTQDRNWLVSPDGSKAAFLRDGNLWVRELANAQERPLTTDGGPLNVYAARPGATRDTWATIGAKPEACWSPDSRRLLTAQTDDRHVAEIPYMEFAPHGTVRPQVKHDRYSLPSDERPAEHRIVSIDVATATQVEAAYRRLPVVRTNDTPCSAGLCWWDAESRVAWFVDIERGEAAVHVVRFDVLTGETHVVFSEFSDTYIDLSVNIYTPALLLPLPASQELVWYSERSGNGHLYLYDLSTGKCTNQITAGQWQVRETFHIDPVRREILFTAAGIDPEEDPYMCRPCVATLDGASLRILSDEPGDHIVWHPSEWALLLPGLSGVDIQRISGVSPDGKYFVETVGRVDCLPHTTLRNRSGTSIVKLETATANKLPQSWKWPKAVALKAADGITDTYGLLFEPHDYDPAKSYPVIDFIYGGPQLNWTPKSVFTSDGNDIYLTAASFAALGAFALILDGRGTGFRERSFHVASHGAMHTASNLEDHIAGIQQLAARTPGLDADRVGITGFSGGGYMSAMGALRFGHFFKVAVSGGGDYDNRLFWNTWAERYHGAYDSKLYDAQAAKSYVDGDIGKILFVHGMLDSGVHPAGLFQLVQALIEANQDMDLLLLPRSGHSMTSYGERRRLDYFVEHLFHGVPPARFKLVGEAELLEQRLAYNRQRPSSRPTAT